MSRLCSWCVLIATGGMLWGAGQSLATACGDAAFKPVQRPGPTVGRVQALAVFAHFADESPGDGTAPDFAADIFDASLPGSLSHFYNEMSRGQFRLEGSWLPRWYASREGGADYISRSTGESGNFGRFAREVFEAVDRDVDWGGYDNDGPDGQPNSGDDDGYVDFVFLNLLTSPSGFIVSEATGVARLGLAEDWVTQDRRLNGGFIRIRGDSHEGGVGGVIQRAHTYEVAVGSMAHEYGHVLGLPDLFDKDATSLGDELDPADDSAGIGAWGLMGRGTLGWGERGGPNPFSAWSLGQLGWIGVNNDKLVNVVADIDDAVFEPVDAGGNVYRIPGPHPGVFFLVEHRRPGNSYYERNLPGAGLLIWRVNTARGGNDDEADKRVDLVCADGLYLDAGFPLGTRPGFERGGDNLDYWARDTAYAAANGGNLGDATDFFDGVLFTEFSPVTNPASPSGISILDIRPQGTRFLADIRLRDPRRVGAIDRDQTWSDTIEVVGDVTVLPGVRLTLDAGAVLRFGPDARAAGEDPSRAELIVQGELVSFFSRRPALLTSGFPVPRPGDWYGVRIGAFGLLNFESAAVEYALEGFSGDNLANLQGLRDVQVRQAARHGLRFEGLQEGAAIGDLTVEGAGEAGAVLNGPGKVRLEGGRMAANGGHGLVRNGGFIDLNNLQFSDNGAAVADGVNLLLGEAAFGRVRGSRFDGSNGLRLQEAGEVVVEANRFVDAGIGLESISAQPSITDNEFVGNELALRFDGFRVPLRFELNTIIAGGGLVENATSVEIAAPNNWWGIEDRAAIARGMSGEVRFDPFLNFDPRLPFDFSLADNYPNPFNASTVIDFAVGINFSATSGDVRMVVDIRNAAGGLVRRLVEQTAAPGAYTAVWDGRNDAGEPVASGVYFYSLDVPPIFLAKSLLLLR